LVPWDGRLTENRWRGRKTQLTGSRRSWVRVRNELGEAIVSVATQRRSPCNWLGNATRI